VKLQGTRKSCFNPSQREKCKRNGVAFRRKSTYLKTVECSAVKGVSSEKGGVVEFQKCFEKLTKLKHGKKIFTAQNFHRD
jgi:hypothetical protein